MNTLKSFANKNSLIGVFILFLLISGVFFPLHRYNMYQAAGKSTKIIDVQLFYTHQDVITLFNDLTPKGRAEYYVQESVTDMAYPIIYGLLFILLITYLSKHLDYNNWWLLLIPPLLSMIFDFSENYTILKMLGSFPNISEATVFRCSIYSLLKWSFVVVSTLIVVSLYVINKKKIRRD